MSCLGKGENREMKMDLLLVGLCECASANLSKTVFCVVAFFCLTFVFAKEYEIYQLTIKTKLTDKARKLLKNVALAEEHKQKGDEAWLRTNQKPVNWTKRKC